MQHFCLVEEEFHMTMQVAMVGTDGIVLASDTSWANTLRAMTSNSRDTSSSSKIFDNGVVAIACARNMETSLPIARAILAEMDDDKWKNNTCGYIELIAGRILAMAEDRADIQCLITTAQPTLQLLHLASGVKLNGVPASVYCRRISDKAVAGDTANAAVFWSERYYRRTSISSLVPLAAQVVVDAGKLHPGYISGLEIALCDGGGIRRMSNDAIVALEMEAKKRGETIGELFFQP
jgi:hypothetical protein